MSRKKPRRPRKPRVAPAAGPGFVAGSRIDAAVRVLLLAFAATLPLYYDPGVPEVAADPRWAATILVAGTCAVLLAVKPLAAGEARLSLRWPLIFWLAPCLVAWAALSLADAVNWMRGLVPLKAMVAQLTLMAVVYLVATPEFLRRLMWALVLPLAFTSLLGVAQFKGWTLPGPAGEIAAFYVQTAVPGSTFANKNLAASWTAMLLPVVLYLLLTARRWPGQTAASILLALGSLFLIYSRTRASWLALLAGTMTLLALVVLVPAWRKSVLQRLDRRRAVWLLLPAVVVLGFGRDVSPLPGAENLQRTPTQQIEALLPRPEGNVFGGRLAYNVNSLAITRDHWINGVGLGNFHTVYAAYHDAIVPTPANGYSVHLRPERAHDDFVQAFVEMGIPGGLLYAGVYACAIAMAFGLAGRRAGALGGMLVGAGVLSALLALTVLLENRGMLALSPPWNLLAQILLAVPIALLIVVGLRAARAVQEETRPADELELLGLSAGIGVLTLCINAIMDFPLQMPTAPAAAALLMGAIASAYRVHHPAAVLGPAWAPGFGPLVLAAWFAGVTALSGLLIHDEWRLRQANALAKAGLQRILAGQFDDLTLEILERAMKAHPYEPRVHEAIGLVHAQYRGAAPLPMETRIARLEWVVETDPWAAHHLVNLFSLHMQRAESLKRKGEAQQTQVALQRGEELFARMQRVAGFSHYTWSMGGVLRLLQDRPKEAATFFSRALAIDPGYVPARTRLAIALERAALKR